MRFFVIFAFLFLATSLFAFAGGNGTASSPYQVSTLMELHDVRNHLDAHFIQTADIDASATNTWNFDFNGFLYRGWDPIGGSFNNAFTGVYDGGGHTISGVVIRREDFTGLFRYIKYATVRNLNLSDIWYSGHSSVGAVVSDSYNSTIANCHTAGYIWSNDVYVGGIAGSASGGSISNCSSSMHLDNGRAMGGIAGDATYISSCIFTGEITTGGGSVGGIIGSANHSTITNCYNTGSITTTGSEAGGIAGKTMSSVTIDYCYSTGAVSASTYAGGIVGDNWYSVPGLNTCFWNTQSSGQSMSAGGGVGLTSTQMQAMYRYVNAGWSMDTANTGYNVSGVWRFDYYDNNRMPTLAWQNKLHIATMQPSGEGNAASPYIISNMANLNWLLQKSSAWDKHYKLAADLDASTTALWRDGNGPTGIGAASSPFTGVFDGQGHTISGFFDHYRGTDYQGLFGYAYGAEIRDLGVINVDIEGGNHTGGLVGWCQATMVDCCYTTGSVVGNNFTGAFIGSIYGGTHVSNCYSRATTDGRDDVGGFAGQIYGAHVTNCLATGYIDHVYLAGGFVCTTLGAVESGCYWDAESTGENTSGCGRILHTYNLGYETAFLTAGWDLLGESENGVEDVWGVDNTTNSGYPFLAWETGGILNQTGSVTPGATDPISIPNVDLTVQFDGTQGVTSLDVVQQFTEPGVTGALPDGVIELLDAWWKITPSGGSAGTYDITFNTSDITGITDFTCLRVLKRVNSASSWVDVRDLGATIVRAEPLITVSGLNAFSDFVLVMGDGSTLPVTLSSFTATVTSENYAQIAWETQSETDLGGYNIYRNTGSDIVTAWLVNGALIEAANSSAGTTYAFTDSDVDPHVTYRYWLESVDLDGSTKLFGPVSVTITPQDGGGGETPEVQLVTSLSGNYPNPFNPSTTIRFSVAREQSGELGVYNLRGQKVCGWSSFAPGEHSVVWDGRDASGREVGGGVYFCRLQTGDGVQVRKMLLMK